MNIDIFLFTGCEQNQTSSLLLSQDVKDVRDVTKLCLPDSGKCKQCQIFK